MNTYVKRYTNKISSYLCSPVCFIGFETSKSLHCPAGNPTEHTFTV